MNCTAWIRPSSFATSVLELLDSVGSSDRCEKLRKERAVTLSLSMQTPTDFSAFPWMGFALGEYGVKELPWGNTQNPRMLQYQGLTGGSQHVD
ncbi:MAG: hypothetical protein JWN04_1369 [Myxococcaceae bacterium]|nr:hypothetical protein [Myxococcaceae bacterium]